MTIDVRCATTCTSTPVVPTGTTAHIEGHLVIVADQAQPSPRALPAVSQLGSTGGQLLFRVVLGVLGIAALLLVALRMRRSALSRP